MLPSASRYTAVLDACVLFPNMKRDLLLSFFEADLYRARWTETIQQEWLSNAIQRYPEKEKSLLRTDTLMRKHFDDAWVEGYESFIPLINLEPDPDDGHVVAAAIKCNAQHIVTDNIKHFPEEKLAEFDIEHGTCDQFLASTFMRNATLSDWRECLKFTWVWWLANCNSELRSTILHAISLCLSGL